MRATTAWLAGARGWVAAAVLAAAVADALVAATLIPGSLGDTTTGSANLLANRTTSPTRARPDDPGAGQPLASGGGQDRVEAQLHERIWTRDITVARAAAVPEGNWEDEVAR
jgi:hypothetical protein